MIFKWMNKSQSKQEDKLRHWEKEYLLSTEVASWAQDFCMILASVWQAQSDEVTRESWGRNRY